VSFKLEKEIFSPENGFNPEGIIGFSDEFIILEEINL
jgi:hypothetical protein